MASTVGGGKQGTWEGNAEFLLTVWPAGPHWACMSKFPAPRAEWEAPNSSTVSFAVGAQNQTLPDTSPLSQGTRARCYSGFIWEVSVKLANTHGLIRIWMKTLLIPYPCFTVIKISMKKCLSTKMLQDWVFSMTSTMLWTVMYIKRLQRNKPKG